MARPNLIGWDPPPADTVEPPSGKKSQGWLVNEKPPQSYFNWLWQQVSKVQEYLYEQLDSGMSLGAALLTLAGAGVARVLNKVPDYTVASRILVEVDQVTAAATGLPVFGVPYRRRYVVVGADFLYAEETINAKWDEATALWSKDASGKPASKKRLGLGQNVPELSLRHRKAATTGTWTDEDDPTGWETTQFWFRGEAGTLSRLGGSLEILEDLDPKGTLTVRDTTCPDLEAASDGLRYSEHHGVLNGFQSGPAYFAFGDSASAVAGVPGSRHQLLRRRDGIIVALGISRSGSLSHALRYRVEIVDSSDVTTELANFSPAFGASVAVIPISPNAYTQLDRIQVSVERDGGGSLTTARDLGLTLYCRE